ncbi:isoleucine--tRNA ligase [Amnibacterium kyonggiense]|uniref:Isoleucine--tRNA ligase n=1 Tax=Amnibacterium kyonggiense TaxID=595671 RepID=A0A4R7FMH8_9MICO|nr:isoleucine--tRNA ligase [Amnibacterium kyonggiense]TDS77667.1 isoleucyl-tRNA synthetase [Amnibacterium kyonggiense]
MAYPKDGGEAVSPSPRFPDIERDVLAFWAEDGTFQASIAQREGAPEWVFYDGPPFANGLPHYGHLLTGYAKDVFPRYQTMRGKQVHRRFGWDTHGLPAELEAMRQLGITTKDEIEQMGVGAFNAAARASVLKYTGEWRDYVTRQARWVDFDDDYKTLDPSFMESVLWAFKTLHDQGLAYEGFRVLPYCWNDETPLSNHELRMDDDVYQRRQDPSVTVTFPLVGEKAEALGLTAVRALAWTTTPWTLPTNLALAVGPDIEYAVVPSGPLGTADSQGADGTGAPSGQGAEVLTADYLVALARVGDYAKELGYASAAEARDAVSRTLLGRELQDVQYDRLWDVYADAATWGTERAWRVLVADYVSTEEGTGVVHQAPAYGEDDQLISTAAGIPTIISVDEKARFLPMFADTELPEVVGLQVFEANRPLIRALRAKGRLLQERSYEHSYPHCWRCRRPLIYKAVSSWFVRVTDYRDRMGELNQAITWVPDNVKDGQFGKWVAGARDWSVSRNRYWGSPIPVWRSDDPAHPRTDVYGSLEQLEADFGRLPRNEAGEVDLHRPYIDELTRPNPDDPTGASTMRRIEDVFDVWFDSGSMPYAQVHYPFENREWFEGHNPADFIVEYIGQTRGWFYVMHALATPLFGRPAFSTVVSHGIVLGNDGQKMSKSLRNYPDVSEVFDRDGSDAMRWFLLASPVLRGGNLIVTEEGIREGVRQVLLPLWSTYYFFTLYAGAEDYDAEWRTDSADPLDRFVLAATGDLVRGLEADLDAFDTAGASQRLRDFADLLTNWYVRLSRERFWAVKSGNEGLSRSSRDAFDTLYTVLETVTRVAAPLLPLVAERVWKGLTGGRSVHLTDWPDAGAFPVDAALVTRMGRLREIVSAALALRKEAGLRVRLPLARLTVVATDAADLGPGLRILEDELNVRAVDLVVETPDSGAEYGVAQRLSVNARALGPRIGKQVQAVIKAAKSGDWSSEPGGGVVVGGVPLLDGEYDLVLERSGATEGTALGLLPSGGFVLLETATTPELELEGHARDFIRDVQQARRAAGLEVTDRIDLAVEGDADLLAMLAAHGDLVRSETLAESLTAAPADAGSGDRVLRWPDGHLVHLVAGTWGAAEGGRFELRRAGGSVLDV